MTSQYPLKYDPAYRECDRLRYEEFQHLLACHRLSFAKQTMDGIRNHSLRDAAQTAFKAKLDELGVTEP